MAREIDSFLKLRPRLRGVCEQEDGWILATLDYDSNDPSLLGLLAELQNQGVANEIRRDGRLVFPTNLGGSGVLDLRIDSGKLPGFFETYDSLIKTHPDIPPEGAIVWEKNGAFHAGYTAACALLQFLKSKAEERKISYEDDYLSPEDVHMQLMPQILNRTASNGTRSNSVSINATAAIITASGGISSVSTSD